MRVFFGLILALLAGAAAVAYFSLFIVHQNEQALVLEFGKPKRVIDKPGLHWKIPVVETVDYFDKRILDLDTQPQEVTASDQKRIVVDAFARYRITDPLRFYQTVRDDRMVRSRLGPILESSIRRVLGSTTFLDLVRDKREELMRRIAQQVNAEGKEFGLVVVDVRIKRADLPEQNSKNIYDRMRAERQREAAEFRAEGTAAANRIRATADREATVIKAEATKKAESLRGEGDAQRNRIFAEAYGKDPDFFAFYRSMQAYKAGIKAGDSKLVLSPQSDFFRFFNNPEAAAPGAKTKAAGAN
ncbi:MAG: protease modulator HflC [Hyphomicrobiaceae bacterium]